MLLLGMAVQFGELDGGNLPKPLARFRSQKLCAIGAYSFRILEILEGAVLQIRVDPGPHNLVGAFESFQPSSHSQGRNVVVQGHVVPGASIVALILALVGKGMVLHSFLSSIDISNLSYPF